MTKNMGAGKLKNEALVKAETQDDIDGLQFSVVEARKIRIKQECRKEETFTLFCEIFMTVHYCNLVYLKSM